MLKSPSLDPGFFKEEKPKNKKETKRSSRFYWTVTGVIAIVAIISVIFLVNSRATIQDQDQQIQSFIAKEKKWENTKAELAKVSEKNAELEKKNENLKAEAEEFKQERNNALNKAQIAKKYGKDMEELALSHAAKFQKLRIENDKLKKQRNNY